MSWASRQGIIAGDWALAPKQAATRGQIAAIMMRFYETILKAGM